MRRITVRLAHCDAYRYVIAVDNSQDALRNARRYVGQSARNVVFVRFDAYADSWASLELNSIDVVFIDAAHDYWSVSSDVWHALQTTARWLVFHDYGSPNGLRGRGAGNQVKAAVDSYRTAGYLSCPHHLGVPDEAGPEGLGCERVGDDGWSWEGAH